MSNRTVVTCREDAVPAAAPKEAQGPQSAPDDSLPFLLDDDASKAGEQQRTELTFAQVPAPPPLSIEPSNHPVQWFQYQAPPISVPLRSDSGRFLAIQLSNGVTHKSGLYVLRLTCPDQAGL